MVRFPLIVFIFSLKSAISYICNVGSSFSSRLRCQGIYYPRAERNSASEESTINDMLLEHIASLSSKNPNFLQLNPIDENTRSDSHRLQQRSTVVEVPFSITPNCPIELVHKKKLLFGNFLRWNGKGVEVQLSSGERLNVDPAQIISCWNELADETLPTTPEDWAKVSTDALEILGNMSPRKSDLQEFWTLTSRRVAVDSLDLGIYIFQERKFKRWMDYVEGAVYADAQAMLACQHYVAALLLFHEEFRFKRRPSIVVKGGRDENEPHHDEQWIDHALDYAYSTANSQQPLMCPDVLVTDSDGALAPRLIQGGYQALADGVVTHREGDAFIEHLNSIKAMKAIKVATSSDDRTPAPPTSVTSKASPFKAGVILRQQRSLEIFSVAPPFSKPPLAVKHLLKRLDLPLTPQGAKAILHDLFVERSSPATLLGAATNSLGGKPVGDRLIGRLRSKAAETKNDPQRDVESTPWPQEVLDECKSLIKATQSRRIELKELPVGRVGKMGPGGRMDYRGSAHPAITVDSRSASFLDDAFSLSPETGEILVHIVDVVGALKRFESLKQVARERVRSTFTAFGPLHMMPVQALDALTLSSAGPSEVITVAIAVDPISGDLLGSRLFPSIIGPVVKIDLDTCEDILTNVRLSKNVQEQQREQLEASQQRTGPSFRNSGNRVEDDDDYDGDMKARLKRSWKQWTARAAEEDGVGQQSRLGFSDDALADLTSTAAIIERVIEANPWADLRFGSMKSQFVRDKRIGVREEAVKATQANRMVNALLTLYSNISTSYCTTQGLAVPIAFEHRDPQDTNLVRRFGTQPLRNWISQVPML